MGSLRARRASLSLRVVGRCAADAVENPRKFYRHEVTHVAVKTSTRPVTAFDASKQNRSMHAVKQRYDIKISEAQVCTW